MLLAVFERLLGACIGRAAQPIEEGLFMLHQVVVLATAPCRGMMLRALSTGAALRPKSFPWLRCSCTIRVALYRTREAARPPDDHHPHCLNTLNMGSFGFGSGQAELFSLFAPRHVQKFIGAFAFGIVPRSFSSILASAPS